MSKNQISMHVNEIFLHEILPENFIGENSINEVVYSQTTNEKPLGQKNQTRGEIFVFHA